MDSLAVLKTSRMILMVSGAVLIIVGLVMVVIQFNHDLALNNLTTKYVETDENGPKSTTNYLGLIVITFGWLLEIIGYLRKPSN